MSSRYKLVVLFAVLTGCLMAPSAQAQELSRWRLGRPALMIDLPGQPGGATVAWTDRAAYSFVANAWAAQDKSVKVEVARIYSAQTPQELLGEIGKKLGAEITAAGNGWLSGRPFVNGLASERAVLVFGAEPGVGSSPAWAVVTTPLSGEGRAVAGRVFDSITLERAGRPVWVLRSLGRTNIVAQLPYELTERTKTANANQRVFEASFDDMSVEAVIETLGANSKFDMEKTAKSAIAEHKGRANVKNFTSKIEKVHLNDKKRPGQLLTMTMTEGTRDYKIFKLYTPVEGNGIIITFTTDGKRTDHHNAVSRILEKLRYSNAVIHGWQTYPVGDGGLFLDLPKAPDPMKKSGTTATTGVFSGPMAVDVREIEYGGPPPTDIDASAAQLLTFMQAFPGHNNVKGTIEKRMVDGLEARLLRTTHQRNGTTNHRDMLVIHGDDRFYVVDSIASSADKDYLDRVVDGARVQLPIPATLMRQSLGQMGVTFVADDKPLKAVTRENPVPGISKMVECVMQFDTGRAVVFEQVHAQAAAPVTADEAKNLVTVMFGQIPGSTVKVRDALPMNVDGAGGMHVRFDHMREGRTERGDLVILNRDKYVWVMTLFTNPDSAIQRKVRLLALNSLRANQ